MKQIFWLNSVIQFVLLLAVWLLMSGHYDFFHISMGVLSALAVMFLHIRLRKYYVFEEELVDAKARMKDVFPVRLRFSRLLFYIPWLIWQIVVASPPSSSFALNTERRFLNWNSSLDRS